MTAVIGEAGTNKQQGGGTLLPRIAGLLVLAYTALFVLAASRCANGLTRVDNQLFITLSVIGALALITGGIPWIVTTGVLGGLAGMYLQPSSSGIVALALLAIGAAHIRGTTARVLAAITLGSGVAIGIAIVFVLMRLTSPESFLCV